MGGVAWWQRTTVEQRADARAGVSPRIARLCRFQRILRAFARVLAFNELESRVGLQVEGSRPQERCLTLFMLALWHAEEQLSPEEVVKVRPAARTCTWLSLNPSALQRRNKNAPRTLREEAWMSDGEFLCPFTAVARGMNVALARPFTNGFTAEELKSICIYFDSEKGQHTGVKAVDREKLNVLLASKNITEKQFSAAMFTHALRPEIFQELEEHLAETRELKPPAEKTTKTGKGKKSKKRNAEDDDEVAPDPVAAPGPGARGSRGVVSRAAASRGRGRGRVEPPPPAAAVAPGALWAAPPAQHLAAAPSASATAFVRDQDAHLRAVRLEFQNTFSDRSVEPDPVDLNVVPGSLGVPPSAETGLRSTLSWLLQPSGSGPLVTTGSGGLHGPISAGLVPTESGFLVPTVSRLLGGVSSGGVSPWPSGGMSPWPSGSSLPSWPSGSLSAWSSGSGGLMPAGSAGGRRGPGMLPVLEGVLIARRSPTESAVALDSMPDAGLLLAASQSADGGGLGPTGSSGATAASIGAQALVFAQLAHSNSGLSPAPSAEAQAAGASVDGYDILAGAAARLRDLRRVFAHVPRICRPPQMRARVWT